MDEQVKPLRRWRVAKVILGLCLIVSALLRWQVALHLPHYLGNLVLGPVEFGALGVAWLVTILAGVVLVLALRGAGVQRIAPTGWIRSENGTFGSDARTGRRCSPRYSE